MAEIWERVGQTMVSVNCAPFLEKVGFLVHCINNHSCHFCVKQLLSFLEVYDKLCQEPGHINKINECILRPDICGAAGKCVDIPDGYRCECKTGYDVGPSGICEGTSIKSTKN